MLAPSIGKHTINFPTFSPVRIFVSKNNWQQLINSRNVFKNCLVCLSTWLWVRSFDYHLKDAQRTTKQESHLDSFEFGRHFLVAQQTSAEAGEQRSGGVQWKGIVDDKTDTRQDIKRLLWSKVNKKWLNGCQRKKSQLNGIYLNCLTAPTPLPVQNGFSQRKKWSRVVCFWLCVYIVRHQHPLLHSSSFFY